MYNDIIVFILLKHYYFPKYIYVLKTIAPALITAAGPTEFIESTKFIITY